MSSGDVASKRASADGTFSGRCLPQIKAGLHSPSGKPEVQIDSLGGQSEVDSFVRCGV